ncbi:two-component system OmpR family response regulator [Roseovarius halotolerans]|uniref:Transcriptional regulatory protein BasR n=1 Tax=Roseovarius halotolerans TaxID=505353 RepID=A0A1X6Y8H7_9RHOB|nr:response regulator transcription factor [Roseovarius halotolerans]RKT35116.1 two-component system OmpR family response regulator [Roseovarius halotolerans]SLN13537.1 Transcriptional regulatory protein BasR [Roseovarius halotolerans]
MRLLLVEDTSELAHSILRALREEGHAVDLAPDAQTATEAMAVADYACVILDLGLPDGSGLEVLKARRRAGDRTPVIIATARDQISDRIAGLDAGADDYVVKPFDLHELSARIRAHARRAQGLPETRFRIADLEIDRAAARVWRDRTEIRLTAREWALFDALLGARGRVLGKTALEDALFAFDDAIEGNAVEVYVSRLRQKLGAQVIETRRGLGYIVP